MEGQEFSYSLYHGFNQFLTVLFDILSRCHVGIEATVKDGHYRACRWISGRTSFQPHADVRKLVLIWKRIRIFDLKRFIRYFKDSSCETNFWPPLTS